MMEEKMMLQVWQQVHRFLEENATAHNSSTTHEGEDEPEIALNTGSLASVILPRITAVLSLFAVVCVFVEALKDLQQAAANKRQIVVANTNNCGGRIRSSRAASNIATVNHIQLFYQIPLFCYSLALALGTNPTPQELNVWGAAGNTITCSFQGFVLQFGIVGTVLWDAALSAAYLVMTRNQVSEQVRARRKKFAHLIIWPVCLVASILPLVRGFYNFSYNTCWIHEFPNNCQGDECIRGAGAELWSSLISFGVMIHLLYSMTIMICLYCTIRGMEDRTQLHTAMSTTADNSSAATGSTSRTYSRAVGIQGMLYTSGMILTMLPTAVYVSLFNFTGLWSEGFSVFALTMTPLVGYVNFCIFMRNRQLQDCHTRYGKFLRRTHSWLFDYDLMCKCECHCLPRFRRHRRGGGPAVGDTAPTTSLPPPPPVIDDDWQATVATAPQRQQQQQQQQQQSAPQQRAALPSESTMAGQAGKWTGILIQTKPPSARMLVSELGLSSVGRSTIQDNHWYDEAPTKPTRLKSQVDSNKPPTPPVRIVSELELQDISNQATAGCGGSQREAPPTKPMRYVSEIEPEAANETTAPPCTPMRYVSEIETVSEAVAEEPPPPCKPVRYVSEIEPIAEEPGEAPPCKPMRYVSEIELPDLEAMGEENSGTTSHLHSMDGLRKHQPPGKPIRNVSEIEQPIVVPCCPDEQPPSKPVRYVSEIDTSEEDPTKHIGTKAAVPTRYYVGEIELPELEAVEDYDDDNTSYSEDYCCSTSREFLPPTKPSRHVSEIEPVQEQTEEQPNNNKPPVSLCSSSTSSRSNRYEGEIEPPVVLLENRILDEEAEEKPRKGAAPPTKPTRYIREIGTSE